MANGQIPGYIRENQPVPMDARAPWYKNTAPTYAGIMLWFVFWQDVPTGGSGAPGGGVGPLSQGLGTAFIGLVAAALICHLFFYLVPGLLGMKTGRPLYIVGTSTYGAQGGFLMPGFLMGVLQFGWLGVNAYFASRALSPVFGVDPDADPNTARIIAIVWAILAAFVGLKGIGYVAKVATFFPILPLATLGVLFYYTMGNIGEFDSEKLVAAAKVEPLSVFGVIALFITYIVGFFATAGAAGVDFGMNNPDGKNVQMGGLVGIALATIVAGGAALLIAAGGFAQTGDPGIQTASNSFMSGVLSPDSAKIFGILLAVAAFPPACFSSFIAANSFKTTLPNVSPFISVGIGTAVSITLAVTGWAGEVVSVFVVIGASFGPVCGAMMVDYLISGRKWAGPRAGFNPAGWISWIVGFVVGMAPLVGIPVLKEVPAAPLAAFIVGAALYLILALVGLESKTLDLESAPAAGDTVEEPAGDA